MELALIVFSMWYANLPIPLQPLFGATASLQQLGEMLDDIKSSEHHLFTLIWNVLRSFEHKHVFTEDFAAILAGVHYLLRLPPQSESRIFASLLSSSVHRILRPTQIEEGRTLGERREVSEAAYIIINLLQQRGAFSRPLVGWRLIRNSSWMKRNVQIYPEPCFLE